jgi:hypothetical protein
MGKRIETAFGKDGYPIVKIGNERLERFTSLTMGDDFIVCRLHHTLPVVHVRTTRPYVAIHRCCSECIKANCTIVSTVIKVGSHERLADGSIIVGKHEDLSE